uniref:Uncharacterized protein n=1 Tax=Arundo donax TaxID=35708 RepID=A0A0A8ZHJ1_ARUDO
MKCHLGMALGLQHSR